MFRSAPTQVGSLTGWEAVSEEGGGLCQTCGVLHRLQMACVNNESWNLCWLLQQCTGIDFGRTLHTNIFPAWVSFLMRRSLQVTSPHVRFTMTARYTVLAGAVPDRCEPAQGDCPISEH